MRPDEATHRDDARPGEQVQSKGKEGKREKVDLAPN